MLGEYLMSTTLTNGLKLPDKGSVDWYADMQNNYTILDGAVGTIAEHTSALSGKAPLVHTHVKSDITDFPAYGNAAGTICEGNDSRLSDARTPVAHTHTKSDVTDLFNTDNVYSANQNFKNSGWEQGVTPANLTSLYLQFIDKNNSSFGAIGFHQDSSGYTFLNILAGDKYANGAKSTSGSLIRNQFRMGTTSAGVMYQSFDGYWGSSLTPLTNNTYDLGTSSLKWKTLNGINPGALSLPGEYSSSVTEYITDKTGGNNAYTAPADGWVGIQANSATLDSGNFIFMGRTSDGSTYFAQNASSPITAYWSNQYHGCILLPVISGETYGIRCKCDTVDARFYKANGNVS